MKKRWQDRALRVKQYLETYAEPETRVAPLLARRYACVLVVPVRDESHDFVARLEPCFSHGLGLCIIVVNASADARPSVHERNRALSAALFRAAQASRRLADDGSMHWLELTAFDVLLIDRATAGSFMPAKQGVGLARRIGADVALALAAQGTLTARGFGSSDADTRLPDSYFSAGERGIEGAAAALFPFVHLPSSDTALTQATQAYELSLRYFVLGLEAAGSPYAYHSLGSTLYVDLSAYLAVRGFPKRLAGEDFYLLNKLAKIRPLRRLREPVVRIESRYSDRVPFGTGPRVAQLLGHGPGNQPLTLYHPRSFEVLKHVLDCFVEFSARPDASRTRARLGDLDEGQAVLDYLDGIDLMTCLDKAARETPNQAQRQRRVYSWFDALKTLRLIHALRDRCHAPLVWTRALAEAPFVPLAETVALGRSPQAPDELNRALAQARLSELRLNELVGVSVPPSEPHSAY